MNGMDNNTRIETEFALTANQSKPINAFAYPNKEYIGDACIVSQNQIKANKLIVLEIADLF